MNTEEKILAMLTQMQEEQKQMRDDITGIKNQQSKMQDDITGIKSQQAKMQDDITGIKSQQAKTQDDITGIKACLDYDVNKRFDAVNEGIDAILEQLTPKSRVDALEADMVVLKTAVKMLTQEVNELKKAQ